MLTTAAASSQRATAALACSTSTTTALATTLASSAPTPTVAAAAHPATSHSTGVAIPELAARAVRAACASFGALVGAVNRVVPVDLGVARLRIAGRRRCASIWRLDP